MDSPACLLVADDESVLTGLTRHMEHRYGGDYELLPARSAQSGLEILERLGAAGRPVALIIADLRMPDMPGVELLSRARRLHPLAKRALLIDYWDFFSSESNEPLSRAMALGQADSGS